MVRKDVLYEDSKFAIRSVSCRGGARNFPTGADFSDEGAKIWVSG